MVTIIDYGVGNLFSLRSSLKFLGIESAVTGDYGTVENAEKIILPGVGAFGDAVAKLRESGLVPALMSAAGRGTPLLGICVGMQALFERSYEYGVHEGLGLLDGEVYSMQDDLAAAGYDLKLPQIGWNAIEITNADCPLLRYTKDGDFFYYVHSYYAKGAEEWTAATSEYGVTVPGVVWKGNVYGTQFHPEKSGSAGLALLHAFCEI